MVLSVLASVRATVLLFWGGQDEPPQSFEDWWPFFHARQLPGDMIRWTWNSPESWDDEGGTNTRRYNVQVRGAGSPAGVNAMSWTSITGVHTDELIEHAARVGEFSQIRIQAVNALLVVQPPTGWYPSQIVESRPRIFGIQFGRAFG